MKTSLLLLTSLLCASWTLGVTIYTADFATASQGSTHDTAGDALESSPVAGTNWELTFSSPSSDGSTNEFITVGGVMRVQDWGGDGTITSDPINITSNGTVDIVGSALTIGTDVFNNVGTEGITWFYQINSNAPVTIFLDETALGGPVAAGTDVGNAFSNVAVTSGDELTVGFTVNVNGGSDGVEVSALTVDFTASGGADVTPPSISTLSPSDDATGVAVDANLVAIFNENVQAATGNVAVKLQSDDSTVETLAIGSANVSIANDTVTINPTSDLANDTGYYVQIDSGALEDTSSNAFAGIADATTWSFTTVALGGGSGTEIYAEDFTGQNNKGAVGPTPTVDTAGVDWTVDVAGGALTATTDWLQVVSEVMEARDVDGEVIWRSPVVNIDDFTNVGITFDASETGGHESGDYLQAFYVLDGGSETSFADFQEAFTSGTGSVTGLNGSTLQLVIRIQNNAGSELIRFDNIVFSGTANTYNANKDLFAAGAIHSGGVTSSTEYYGQGNGNGSFSEYGIASFSFTKSDFGLSAGATINDITSAVLTLTHNDRTFTTPTGTVEFFLTVDGFSGNFAGLAFDTNEVDGINDTEFSNVPVSLGQFAYTAATGGVQDQFTLDLSGVESSVLAQLNAEGEFSIIIAPVGASDSITYAGLNNTFDPGNPNLELGISATNSNDSTPPSIASLSPIDDGADFAIDGNLVITFDENVQAGTGNIVIHLASNDSVVETVAIGSGNVTINNASVTIDLTSNLDTSTAYYVQIDNGAIEDVSANAFAGISDTTSWNFSTAAPDLTAPNLVTLSPADDSNLVANNANLEITFNENIAAGSGNITIKLTGDDSTFETVSIGSGKVSINGDTITVDPTGTFADNTDYYVQIDGGAIEDTAGNAFAGFSDKTIWNFLTDIGAVTPDATATKDLFALAGIRTGGDIGSTEFYAEGSGQGQFAIYSIASFQFSNLDFALNGAQQIDNIVSADLTLTHNDRSFTSATATVEFFLTTDTYNGNYAGLTNTLAVINGIDNSEFTYTPVSLGQFPYTAQAGGAQDTFTLDLSGVEADLLAQLQNGAEFSIIIAAVGSLDAITYSGLNNTFDPGNPSLTLEVTESAVTDTTAPVVASFDPSDDAIGVIVNSNLLINFNEIIQKGTGNITIRRSSNNSIVETIDVTTPQVTANLGTLTINPAANFDPATSYYVQVDAGAVLDTSGNSFAGIVDTTTYDFTTTTPAIDTVGPFTTSENALSGTVIGDLNSAIVGNEGFQYAILAGDAAPTKMKPVAGAGFKITPVFTAGDAVSGASGALNSNTPGNFSPVGVFDGIGAYELDVDTVRVFFNHEIEPEQGYAYQLANGTSITGARVSYLDIDKATRSVVDGGYAYDTIYDRSGNIVTAASQINERGHATEGFDRMCSSSLYEANSFGAGRGLADRIYMNGEEAAKTFGSAHGGTVWALDVASGGFYAVPAMGRGSWENVALLDTGTTTHVAFVLGDDLESAPLYLYVGEKGKDKDGLASSSFLARNGLEFGTLYVWRADNGNTTPQQFFGTGSNRAGTFVEIDPQDVSQAGQAGHDSAGYKDGTTMRSESDSLGGFSFSRPEDLATDPNDGTRFAFASTGRGNLFPFDKWGCIYIVDVDFTNLGAPTADIDLLYDADDQGGGQFFSSEQGLRNPDNLDWADDNFLYIQEDRAGGATTDFANSGQETSIWKVDSTTGQATRIAQMCRDVVLPLGSTDGSTNDLGNWESSGILDVSSLFGEAGGSLFLFNVQAHSVTDGLIAANNLVQGAQMCFMEANGGGPAFRINPNSGVITINDASNIDTSVRSQYVIRIQAFDGVSHVFDSVTIDINSDVVNEPSSIRFATFNGSMAEFPNGLIAATSITNTTHINEVAEIIQINNADVILINEFDYDSGGQALRNFLDNYLAVPQNGQSPVYYGYTYLAPVNTGVHSGFDLDNNGSVVSTPGSQAYGDDAFGFGEYEGQYGMVLLSKYPINYSGIRTFQQFLWKDMPNNLLPPDPLDSDGDFDTGNYYTAAEQDVFRLSSKSHWDVPILVGSETIHALCAHPTPPAFDDGTETDFANPTIVDENGRRNHDEIRFWADYIKGESYIYDDAELISAGNTTPPSPTGGFTGGEKFVILGDYNADPDEGDSTADAALQFTDEPLINNTIVPTGIGGPEPSDTADFVGGLRVDYALPSANQTITGAGVFWPSPEGIAAVSDHHLVYVDLFVPVNAQVLLSYYQSAEGLTGTALQNALHDIIDDHTQVSYGDAPDVFRVIDEDESDSSAIRLIYSLATLSKSSGSWNREHVWPRSLGVGDNGPDHSDLHSLFPCQSDVNSLRSNLPFDESTGGTTSNSFAPESTRDSNSWEPLDRDKGMVARAVFYMMVRYDGSDPSTTNLMLSDSPSGSSEMGILSTLLEWNRAFPPTAYEIERNNQIYEGVDVGGGNVLGQFNRNPFIDFYQFADAIFLSAGDTTYEKFVAEQFTLEQLLEGTDTSPNADPNFDGVSNYLHFLTNTSANGVSGPLLDFGSPAPLQVQISFFRPLSGSVPEQAKLERSTTLDPMSWIEVPNWENDATITTTGDYEEIEYDYMLTPATEPEIFFRVNYE